MNAIQALNQQRLLLQLEYQVEKETFRRQTEQTGIERMVQRGDAWYPVRLGRSYYNSMNQLALEVYREGEPDTDHNFEYGRPVIFFVHNPNSSLHSLLASPSMVSYVDGNRMVIILPDSNQLLDLQRTDATLGVQLSFDETSYRCMFEDLNRTINAKGR
ncbi:MAG: helicase, partial [Prevotella sp.]|nr:helicase [Prevotella sp.]